MTETQNSFSGWAKVEIMGHQTHIGFVTTEVYGQAVMFRIDQPAFEEREYTLPQPTYTNLQMDPAGNLHETKIWPAGTKVKRGAMPAASTLVGSASIYRITPCTEEAARAAIERQVPRPLILIEAPAPKAIAAGAAVPIEARNFRCCGRTPEEGHEAGCPVGNGEAEEEDFEGSDTSEEQDDPYEDGPENLQSPYAPEAI